MQLKVLNNHWAFEVVLIEFEKTDFWNDANSFNLIRVILKQIKETAFLITDQLGVCQRSFLARVYNTANNEFCKWSLPKKKMFSIIHNQQSFYEINSYIHT